MPVILQDTLPDAQSGEPRLPGTLPCDADDWLRVDEAYAAQLQYRMSLLAEQPDAVLYEHGDAQDANLEVLTETLKILPNLGFTVTASHVTCPDGRIVPINFGAPLLTMGHLVQEDICVLTKQGAEHVMTGAVLCFPANWRLAEKINRPLTGIHDPVDEYDAGIAARVQRLFDGVKVRRPMWRFNKLPYSDADLHQPYKRELTDDVPFIRSERQCILRLPETGAVGFTIHSVVVRT
jgi:hypothetical protein